MTGDELADELAPHGQGLVVDLGSAVAGAGDITINGTSRDVGSEHLALIPRGAKRSVRAGPEGISYLSVHRQRGPLTINKPT